MASALIGSAFSVPSMSLKMMAPPEKVSLTIKGQSYLYENFPRESGVTCKTLLKTRLRQSKYVWMFGTLRVRRGASRAILVVHRHFFDDLLDVFIRRFHRTVHLRTIWCGIAMSYFKLCTELVDDLIIQILDVVRDDCRGDSVASDDVALDKACHGFYDPFSKVVIPTRINRCPLNALGLIGLITSIPHIEKGHGAVIGRSSLGGALI
ncbi:hypothetical protein CRG98_023202 [Punica granatum]|uniref:Uncharacterized protein n=1 Tax=Punica granatum TaxID=22663 RepID=A0A2I0JJF7_PUNGR|nr:hypothetical protein CRG98_023202 [Punica granatum]